MKYAILCILGAALAIEPCRAAEIRAHLETGDLPASLRDRGDGVPMSIFGTYVQPGQLLVYPFFEYYRNPDAEYTPSEFGFTGEEDFRGEYSATEELIFIGYGLNDRVAFEIEAAIIQAKLEKSSADPSAMPATLEEDGIGDVEGQIRWRWNHESDRRPEVFSYFETVAPTQDEGSLIGTTDWEFKLGTGLIRGVSWGTLTVRAALEYGLSEDKLELGEVAVEYLRRLSSQWRVFAAVEGTQDEFELITSAQWHLHRRIFVNAVNAVGLTSKASDWAPEIGVMFSFP